MFFDRAMLAMGNILFLIGIPLILGPQKTLLFFLRPQKARGTLAFTIGIALILLRWAFVGFLIEGYGIGVLFGDFLGTVAGYAGGVPYVGVWVRRAVDWMGWRNRNAELPV
jgi:hypothetical protein